MRRLGIAGKRFLATALSTVMIAGMSFPTAAAYTVDVSAGIAGSKVSVTVEDENVQENAAEDTAGVVTAGDSDEGSIVAGAAASGGDSLEAVSGDEVSTIEINQGLSYHTGLNDGNETYINDFVAKKTTAIFAKLPGTESKTETEARNTYTSLKLEAKAVTNGQESDNCELTADNDSFTFVQAYDADCDVTQGWYVRAQFPQGPDKGTYNFHLTNNGAEIAKNEGVNFYETTPLNILVVPVKGYWSAHYEGGAPSAGAFSCKEAKFYDELGNEKEWSELCGKLKEYLLDVYPVADITIEEGNEVEAGDASYDMVASEGQKKLWEEVCKLQSKNKEGKDKYDLILAFVQYRQDQGGGQGYTFGKPTNIITYSDKDMLPTVAHEIAHCYQVGDEYNGGSFNNSVNYPPNGYKGRNYVSGEDIAQTDGANDYWKTPKAYKESKGDNASDKVKKINENGAGTMVSPGLHPYSLSQKKLITWAGVGADGNATGDEVCPTISYMGSNYSGSDGYYWTSSVIWDHLFKKLVSKEKKEETTTEQSSEGGSVNPDTNADVYLNAVASGADDDSNSIFNEDDFYYGDDVRFGESRMIEVSGWLVAKSETDHTLQSVEMDPMFSYDGDLEFITPLEECYKDSSEIYTFVPLDASGNVMRSQVDNEPATVEFYGGFYNPNTKKTGAWEKEVNFKFDCAYPSGTSDFIIVKGKVSGSEVFKKDNDNSNVVWRASNDPMFESVTGDERPDQLKPEGYLTYANVTAERADVEWDVYYPDNREEPYDYSNGALYTEVYYCPEGDEGEIYYVGCSEDEDWTNGQISFATDSQFATKWTRNAYVWIKVTNGVNATDIYSDANDVTLCYSDIALSGTGVKKVNDGHGNITYVAEYAGGAVEPNTTVKAMNPETGKYSISLKRDVDYTVTYENNTKVGTGTVVVQGIGAYAGKNVQDFEIVKKSLVGTPENIPDVMYSSSLDSTVQKYLVMKDKSNNQLVYGKDFTVKFTVNKTDDTTLSKLITENPEASTAVTVTYVGKGSYSGECSKKIKFNVLPADSGLLDLSSTSANVVIELKKDSVQYNGKPQKPAIKSVYITYKAAAEGEEDTVIKLKGSDYKAVYTNNVDLGTGRVTIVGKKKYTGSAHTTFSITPKEVTSLSVKGLKNQEYTGSAVDVTKLPLVIKAGGITLTKDVDYTISANPDCNYTDVTTASVNKAGQKPQVVINLKTMTDEERATTKSANQPKVVWKSTVKDEKKTVVKTFSIVQANFKSSSVTSLTMKSTVSANNIVKNQDGKTIGTIRAATKQELSENNNKFAYVIEGNVDAIDKTADISGGAVLKAYGNAVDAGDYTVSVSKTKDGKIGKITYKANKNTSYKGSRVFKFMYIKR